MTLQARQTSSHSALPLACIGLLLCYGKLEAQGLYKPIPAGFDFPADQTALLTIRDNKDVAAMRHHAWMVFAGLTQPARPNEADSEAVWETWYHGDEVFAPAGPSPQGIRKAKRVFTPLRQSVMPGVVLQAAGQSVASFTLFNQETKDHIRTNRYQMAEAMDALNASWPIGGPPQDRKIKDFPAPSMSLKTTWWVVKKNQPTGMYIWDEKAEADPAGPQPAPQWKRAVIVDPTRAQIPADESANTTIRGKQFPDSHVVPLSAFYHFTATADDLSSLNSAPVGTGEDPNLGQVEVGDFLVLAAMHFTTKEIPQWVWATFWWHDRPDVGPYAENRPDARALKSYWRNYKMDVTLDMTTPAAPDGKQKVIFNPWLEARFKDGVHSNCMACHQLADWPRSDFLPIQRGPLPHDAQRFRDTTKMDFLWSLRMEGGQ
jgi:hypothetical protein